MHGAPAIEQRIRDALANKKSAIALSNQLFAPTGLFNEMAQNEADRREMVQSSLYKEAQKRLNLDCARSCSCVRQNVVRDNGLSLTSHNSSANTLFIALFGALTYSPMPTAFWRTQLHWFAIQVNELQRREAAEFSQTVQQSQQSVEQTKSWSRWKPRD